MATDLREFVRDLALVPVLGACAAPGVLATGARSVALAAIACDAAGTASVAARDWPDGTGEYGPVTGRLIGHHPSAPLVGGFFLGYAVAALAAVGALPRSWRAPVLVGLAAYHVAAGVVPNARWTGPACGL